MVLGFFVLVNSKVLFIFHCFYYPRFYLGGVVSGMVLASRENSRISFLSEYKNHKQFIGKTGEEIAVVFLESLGWEILVRNFYSKYGEVDIVAVDNSGNSGVLVFIEVKSRTNFKYGGSIFAITSKKKATLNKMVSYCLLVDKRFSGYTKYRIDGILIDFDCENLGVIRHFKGI